MKSFKITQSITNIDDIAIKDYLKDVSKIKLNTKEEEYELGTIIQTNLSKLEKADRDERRRLNKEIDKAVNKLVCGNLKFVVSVAKQFKCNNLSLIDLINEGNYGLIVAAKKFQPKKGFKFISYAVWWIRQAIMLAINIKNKTVKIPTSQGVILQKIKKYSEEFENKHGYKIDDIELSKITHIPLKVINSSKSNITSCVYLDKQINTNNNDNCSLLEVIEDTNLERTDSNIIKDSNRKEIDFILNKLSPKKRTILKLYFGIDCENMQLEQIAPLLGYTSERIRQIKNDSLKELKLKYSDYLKKLL